MTVGRSIDRDERVAVTAQAVAGDADERDETIWTLVNLRAMLHLIRN
jgi:hypothetical protein